jgi:glycerol kinase
MGSKKNRYIVSVDQSTSSTKAMVVDSQGRILSESQLPHKQYYPEPGWLEHDPLEIYKNTLSALRSAVASSDLDPSDISVLSITNQRETVLLWDRRTGKPVSNAIVWQCRRTSGICEQLKAAGHDETVREKTGLLIDPYFSASKVKWIFDNVAGVAEKAKTGEILMGTIDSWLLWKLTGGRVHATDYTNASRTLLFNIRTLDWDRELLSIFNIPEKILPEVRSSDAIFGNTEKGELFDISIPISGVIGDSQGALFGQNCFEPGMLKTTFGTGSSVMMYTGKELYASRSGLVSSIAWGIGGSVYYAVEGIIHSTGDTINWVVENLGIAKDFREVDREAQSLSGNEGVYLIPAFFGLGIPYWNMGARAAIVGLSRKSNASNISRAAIESVAYQIKDAVEQMQTETGIKPVELRADGGLTNSEVFMQFLADMLDFSVVKTGVSDLSLMGSAYIAGLSMGIWKDLKDIGRLREVLKMYRPSMKKDMREELYDGWKKAVKMVL